MSTKKARNSSKEQTPTSKSQPKVPESSKTNQNKNPQATTEPQSKEVKKTAPQQAEKKPTQTTKKEDPKVCYRCKEAGHFAHSCPTKKNEKEGSTSETTLEPAEVVQEQPQVSSNHSEPAVNSSQNPNHNKTNNNNYQNGKHNSNGKQQQNQQQQQQQQHQQQQYENNSHSSRNRQGYYQVKQQPNQNDVQEQATASSSDEVPSSQQPQSTSSPSTEQQTNNSTPPQSDQRPPQDPSSYSQRKNSSRSRQSQQQQQYHHHQQQQQQQQYWNPNAYSSAPYAYPTPPVQFYPEFGGFPAYPNMMTPPYNLPYVPPPSNRSVPPGQPAYPLVPPTYYPYSYSAPIQLDVRPPNPNLFPQIVDIGVNLTHPFFRKDLQKVISKAFSKGVKPLIVTGTSTRASESALVLSEQYEGLYCTAGVHPHEASSCNNSTIPLLEQLASNPKVVAIGECGLDFNRNFSPPEVQEQWFREQVLLAIKLKKPLFLHQRDAHNSFMKIISEFRENMPPAVIHCFTGSEEECKEYVKLGFYIGFTGIICNKTRGEHLRNIIKKKIIPLDKIMIETDAPFMTPPNMHNYVSRNEPAFLTYVLEVLAENLGESKEKVAQWTTQNAYRFFNLPTEQTSE